MCVCVCVCVSASVGEGMRVRVCVHLCLDVGTRARACASSRVALRIQQATRGRQIICDLSGFTIIFKKSQISSFIKIRPLGAELFHADRQTDRRKVKTKLTVAFCKFCEHP